MKVKCNKIKIGERVRNGSEDVDELVEQIKEFGLLQPIGITKDNDLVFGGRRLAACKKLNYKEIEVVVVESDNLFGCEIVENVGRREFNMPERVKLRERLKEKEERRLGKIMEKGIKVKRRKVAESDTFYSELAKQSGVSYDTAKKENIIMAFKDKNIINNVIKGELSINKAHCLIKKMKKESEAKDNKVNVLPAEETVEVETEQSDVDNNIYIITISDTSDSLELSEELTNKIKNHIIESEMSPVAYIEFALNHMFKD